MHSKEYDEYLRVKQSGKPRPIINLDELRSFNLSDDDDSQPTPRSEATEPPGRLTSSLIFKCNLFQLVSREATTASALCLVCEQNGQTRYVKGKTTTNYHLHMKVSMGSVYYFPPHCVKRKFSENRKNEKKKKRRKEK